MRQQQPIFGVSALELVCLRREGILQASINSCISKIILVFFLAEMAGHGII